MPAKKAITKKSTTRVVDEFLDVSDDEEMMDAEDDAGAAAGAGAADDADDEDYEDHAAEEENDADEAALHDHFSQSATRSAEDGAAEDKDEDDPDFSEDNVMRILIATDNHLGAHEKDRVRKEDSFLAFEEILALAKTQRCDFIVLGGDLFNDNKPSRETLHKTMELFRKYCVGDRPVPLKIHSDQRVNFSHNFGAHVNYEDPNFNIAMPVFAIHGNHDDPTGENGLSALDLLAMSNLINYFGKSDSIDDVKVNPILISKGLTQLALYGLGHIRDERLYRTFQQKKVKFFRPKENKDDWFNLFMIHQNRHRHGGAKKSTISEAWLRGFFDLVVWGHEHEQLIQPRKSAEGNFEVMQPGSSVVTSLIREETKQKKVALLEIYKTKFKVTPLNLLSTRAFVMADYKLRDVPELEQDKSNTEEVMRVLEEKVNEMIEESKKKMPPEEILKAHPMLRLPLVRLRVDHSGGYATINPQRFGQRFVDKVANPSDLLVYMRRSSAAGGTGARRGKKDAGAAMGADALRDMLVKEGLADDSGNIAATGTIEHLVQNILENNADKLAVLTEISLQEAVDEFVQKEEPGAIKDWVEKHLEAMQKKLWKRIKKSTGGDLKAEITESELRDLIEEMTEEERQELKKQQDQQGDEEGNTGSSKKASSSVKEEADEEADAEDEEMPGFVPATSKSKTPAGKKGAKSAAAASSKKKSSSKVKSEETDEDASDDAMDIDDDDGDDFLDDDDEEEAKPKKKTAAARGGRGRGRGRGAAATSTRGRGGKKAYAASSSKFKSLELDDDSDAAEEAVPAKTAASKKRTRASTAATSKSKAKVKGEPQDSDADDDILSFDEEDTAPKTRGGSKAGSSKVKSEEQGSDDEAPAAKKRKTTAASSSSKKSEVIQIDDDDDDDVVAVVAPVPAKTAASSTAGAAAARQRRRG